MNVRIFQNSLDVVHFWAATAHDVIICDYPNCPCDVNGSPTVDVKPTIGIAAYSIMPTVNMHTSFWQKK